MAVLLIGSTGSGKSTLGNYLIDPSDSNMFSDHPVFEMAKTNLPQTQFVQQKMAALKISERTFLDVQVIDTPGLNESSEADLRHMIDMIEKLQKTEEIKACILVVKFDAKIDAQYVATVKYYKNLLPQLFERNVIIVMTEYCTDMRSESLRQKKGVNPDEVKRNTLKQVVKTGCLNYRPMIFTIDCLPFMELEEIEHSKNVRMSILRYISQMPSVHTKNLRIEKTEYLKKKDKMMCGVLQGEIQGYTTRLIESTSRHAEIIQKTEKKEELITDIRQKLQKLRKALENLNTDELGVANTHSIEKPWRAFRWQREPIKVETKCQIADVKYWTNSHCKWKDVEQSIEERKNVKYHIVSGAVEGEFMRGLYASVTLLTEKRMKYALDIAHLQEQIATLESEYANISDHLKDISACNVECESEIDSLRQFIKERRKRMEEISYEWMTVEQAKIRLQEEFQTSSQEKMN